MCKRQEEERNAVIRAAIEGRDQSKVLPLPQREKVILEILPPSKKCPRSWKPWALRRRRWAGRSHRPGDGTGSARGEGESGGRAQIDEPLLSA